MMVLISTFLYDYTDNYLSFYMHFITSVSEVIAMGFYLYLFIDILTQNKEQRMTCMCIEIKDDTEI